jgi:hypothetical protein
VLRPFFRGHFFSSSLETFLGVSVVQTAENSMRKKILDGRVEIRRPYCRSGGFGFLVESEI